MANGISEGFIAHTEIMLAALRAELRPYEAGTASAGTRPHGGDWVDINAFRIEQIKREIKALENSLAKRQESHA